MPLRWPEPPTRKLLRPKRILLLFSAGIVGLIGEGGCWASVSILEIALGKKSADSWRSVYVNLVVEIYTFTGLVYSERD
ncbi:hypothetical protein CCP3SC1_20040 [Gammaproteobacteria bacterium]